MNLTHGFRGLITAVLALIVVSTATAQYSGGTGEPNDPYQIATAADLIALGETPDDYDKHFILTADIDLDPNFPGGRVFDKAVIGQFTPGSLWLPPSVTAFSGIFDGQGHTIARMTITGEDYLGLFGELASGAEVRNLAVVDVNVIGSGNFISGLVGFNEGQVSNLNLEHAVIRAGGQQSRYLGALAGLNRGSISNCTGTDVLVEGQSVPGGTSGYVGGLVGYSNGDVEHCRVTGNVRGDADVGGLMGLNHGSVLCCRADTAVSGRGWLMGGLIGVNIGDFIRVSDPNSGAWSPGDSVLRRAVVKDCCAAGEVAGDEGSWQVGGLVGSNQDGDLIGCYATGAVSGDYSVGGLVGGNEGTVSTCYATGKVAGNEYLGGLVAWQGRGETIASFWDIETSGHVESAGGTGKTTAEMQTAGTFLGAGWDFVGETANGIEDIWWIDEGQDYPRLWWEPRPPVRLPVIELDATNFDAGIAQGVVLVDFFATWCSHCTTQAPILEEVADRLEGRAQVAKLDVDQAKPIVQQYGVTAVPTLVLFREGIEVKRFVGVTSADVLVAAILAVVDSPE